MFFIWKHLDLFVAMQQYLSTIASIDRPSFKDVIGSKCQDDYPAAFNDDVTDTFNTMTKVKSSSTGVITTGLWPLDHESYYDWRHTSHKKSVWKQWIHMARIEKIIVNRYRAKMLRKCPPSAVIRDKLQSLLSPLCTPNIVPSRSKPASGETQPQSNFYWPDKVKVQPEPVQSKEASKRRTGRNVEEGKEKQGHTPAAFHIEEVKSEQLRQEETQAMVSDITAIFKRLHSTKAGLAVRGKAGFFRPIVEKLDALEVVSMIDDATSWRLLTVIYSRNSNKISLGLK